MVQPVVLPKSTDPIPSGSSQPGSVLYFVTICFIAALGGFLFGFDTAVIDGVNVLLKAQFEMSSLKLGWVVSSALVGCMIGAAIGGWLSDSFGRKNTLLFTGFLFALTSVGCAISPNPDILIWPRLISGIAVGAASVAVPLYIAEISPPHVRGRMVSFYQFAITIGIVSAYLSNAMIHKWSEKVTETTSGGLSYWLFDHGGWRVMLGAMAIPSVIFFFLLFLVPESPRFLVKLGQSERAQKVLARVMGQSEAGRAMSEIRETLAQETGSWGELRRPGVRRALWMAMFLAIAAQLSGINAIIYYGTTIIEQAGFALDTALLGQLAIGTVNVIFTLLAMWQVDKMGRRLLMLIGSIGACLSLAAVGGVLAGSGGEQSGQMIWLLVFVSGYLACFAFSLGPLPWVFMSEVFPTQIRGRAMSIATFSVWAANAVVIQTSPWLRDPQNFGPHNTFWLHAALVVPVIFFAWKIMPETKGRSLEQIEVDMDR